jgi:hypothetical protein
MIYRQKNCADFYNFISWARFYIFLHIQWIFSSWWVSLGGHHLLDPPGHGVAQPLEVVLGDACGPHDLDLVHFGQGSLLLQLLSLH